ncbi:hypothetical protein [Gloeocapsopsis dulcis]|uniref:hypothetical protein n=1 Tax=Gloeocapsopsis dulcis TaxID=2859516 RepID=UPI00101ADD24|nr:hypothetical protein [Gloeocapsopsis dulcis]WNN87802.1 hypothetical protein P0S91_15965 [Gloeocapsopsis dulcis]
MANNSSSYKLATTHLLPKKQGWFWLSLLVSCTTSGNLTVLAQTVPPLPPTADPSRIQQQLQPPESLPPQQQEITVPRPKEFTPPPGAEQQKFVSIRYKLRAALCTTLNASKNLKLSF